MNRWVGICLILALSAASASAQTMEGAFAQFFGGRAVPANLRYRLLYYDTSMQRQELATFVPFAKREVSEWHWGARAKLTTFNEAAVIPGSTIAVPERLYDIDAGIGLVRKRDNGHRWSMDMNLGSASDEPFDEFDELVVNAAGLYSIPDGKNAWLLMLQFSNSRSFLPYVPLPGVAYFIDHQKDYQLMVGLPFLFATTTVGEKLFLRAVYVAPYRADVGASWTIGGPYRLEAAFTWQQERWFRAARSDSEQILFYDDFRLYAGLKGPILSGLNLELGGGYAWGRAFFEGSSYSDASTDTLNLDNTPFAQASLQYNFL